MVSAVDGGTLLLTDRRFIFAGGQRQREFLLGELTHFSTIEFGVALAASGQLGMSFFTGIKAQRIKVDWPASVRSETVSSYMVRAMTGNDLEYLVQLLQPKLSVSPA
jgi:hypothetical protein